MLLTIAALGILLCNPNSKDIYPAGTCILTLENPLPEETWLTFFSGTRVIVAGNFPVGTKSLSIGPQNEKIYLMQFLDGEQIKAEWLDEIIPEITIQPIGEPLMLKVLKTPLTIVKSFRKLIKL